MLKRACQRIRQGCFKEQSVAPRAVRERGRTTAGLRRVDAKRFRPLLSSLAIGSPGFSESTASLKLQRFGPFPQLHNIVANKFSSGKPESPLFWHALRPKLPATTLRANPHSRAFIQSGTMRQIRRSRSNGSPNQDKEIGG